jgi:ubiquinone/menaquinone biosynthesis C-methylase UbiE
MRNKPLNYNQIAADYNLRYGQDQYQGTLNALRRILSQKKPDWVLEIGCGTCHWLERLRGKGHHVLVGVDKAFQMLKQTNHPNSLLLCQGTAENVPIKNESFGLIYCVNALHHFSEPKRFIHQANRLLKPGGTLAIIGMNPRDSRNSWYIYDFFKGTLARDLDRFPDWPKVRFWMEKSNFSNILLQDVEFIHDPKTTENVLKDPFLKKHACSQLALLDQSDYQNGINKIKQHVYNHRNPGYQYENDIVLSMLCGEKNNKG